MNKDYPLNGITNRLLRMVVLQPRREQVSLPFPGFAAVRVLNRLYQVSDLVFTKVNLQRFCRMAEDKNIAGWDEESVFLWVALMRLNVAPSF